MRNLSQYQPYQQSWVLPQGCAQTFVPVAAGVLRVTAGRAWVTLGQGLAGDDVFLERNASMPLRAGQAVVLEAWLQESEAQLQLEWEAAPQCVALPDAAYVPTQAAIGYHLCRWLGLGWRTGYGR